MLAAFKRGELEKICRRYPLQDHALMHAGTA